MAGNSYKIIELVGTSSVGVSEAIEAAVSKAAETLRGLDWFEVGQVRGRIEAGGVVEYQVGVRIGFRLMSEEELKGD